MEIKKKKPTFKKGLEGNTTSSYVEFGKYMIQRKFLQKGELLTKYKNSYAPTLIKRTKVTKLFETILQNIIDVEEINYALVQDLNEDEQNLLKRLIEKSGMSDKLDFDERKIEPSVTKLIEKFNVLKGEIVAGNDNPTILIDMTKVLNKLRERNVIDEKKKDEIMELITT